MKEIYKLLGIEGNYTTAYHPQTNGQTECMNQEIEHYLRLYINYKQNDWHEWLPMAEFAFNDRIHSATKVSPFYAEYGRHPRKGIENSYKSNNPLAQDLANHIKDIRIEVESSLKKAAEDMNKYYDKHRSNSREYSTGDMVWLDGHNITSERPMKKLDDKRWGPFKIIKKVGASSYKLDIPKTWKKVHPVFNEVLLSPYTEPEFPTQPRNTRPLPIAIEGEEPEYEVEEILDSRKTKAGKMYYKVKWKGYGPHEYTWEPITNITNADEEIENFHTKYPSKPKPRAIRKIEIPIHLFPKDLFRPLPNPDTESIPTSLPTENMAFKFARNGVRALKGG